MQITSWRFRHLGTGKFPSLLRSYLRLSDDDAESRGIGPSFEMGYSVSVETVSLESRHKHGSRILLSIGTLITWIIVVVEILFIELHSNNALQSVKQPVTQTAMNPVSISKALWDDCGLSPEVARSRGCLFDILSFAWQTPQCYDEDVIRDFLNVKEWDFYADESGNHQVEIGELENDVHGQVHVAWDFHVMHCIYMRRQMLRSILDGRAMDSHLNSYHHTRHCVGTILDREIDLENLHTAAPVIYPSCELR